MLRLISLVFCFFVLAGCGLFRNTEKTTLSEKSKATTSSSLTEHQDLKTVINENALLIKSDSTNSQLTTIIWPRGKFKYSVDSGFVGEAEKVEQVAFGKRVAKTSKVNQKQVDLVANLERKSNAEELISKTVKVEKTIREPRTHFMLFVFVVVALCIVIGVAIVYRKKLSLATHINAF